MVAFIEDAFMVRLSAEMGIGDSGRVIVVFKTGRGVADGKKGNITKVLEHSCAGMSLRKWMRVLRLKVRCENNASERLQASEGQDELKQPLIQRGNAAPNATVRAAKCADASLRLCRRS